MAKKKAAPPSLVAVKAADLAIAARDFAEICDEIDAAEGATQMAVLHRRFADIAQLNAYGVDRTGALVVGFENQAVADRERAAKLIARAKLFENAVDLAKDMLCKSFDSQPDLPWRGERYRIRTQVNGQAAVHYALARPDGSNAIKDKLMLSNVVDADVVFEMDMPEEFYETVIVTRLKSDEIRKVLQAGKVLGWATLERGRHARIEEI